MYIDGFVAAVPSDRKAEYLADVRTASEVYRDHGATRVIECWGDDVPDGEVTSFPMAVKAEPGEVVVFAWIEYPDRETRDRCHKLAQEDPRFAPQEGVAPVFDAKRMIWGGFSVMVDD